MAESNMICIVCPMGCRMTVEAGDEIKVSGNTCSRGYAYAVKECTNPTRSITTTVKVEGAELPVIPVKTSGEVPKNMIRECMRVIREIRIEAPVEIGDVVLKNILGTGVDIIASRAAPVRK